MAFSHLLQVLHIPDPCWYGVSCSHSFHLWWRYRRRPINRSFCRQMEMDCFVSGNSFSESGMQRQKIHTWQREILWKEWIRQIRVFLDQKVKRFNLEFYRLCKTNQLISVCLHFISVLNGHWFDWDYYCMDIKRSITKDRQTYEKKE